MAREEKLVLIDLQIMSQYFYEARGPENGPWAFSHSGDITHHNNCGSYELAKCIIEGIRQKKLQLPCPAAEWYALALSHHQLREIPINGEIAIAAATLPLIHNDPCDRIIIATALERNFTIITGDPIFAKYQKVKICW